MSARTVLIVEDEKPLRDVYEIVLSTAGYQVTTAVNGSEGLKAIEQGIPDFILLDIFMPIMNGIEFLRAVKPYEHPNTAIVVFSNNSDSGVREEASRLGARDVVLKADVSPVDLVSLVASYVPPSAS